MNTEPPTWLFQEAVQVGVDYTDAALVADYDKQHEGFRNFEQEAKSIVEDLALSKDSIVLDIGCGTGGLTMHLAQMCQQVYAVDSSAAMIAALTRKIQTQGFTNVTPVHAGFLTYQHQGRALDAVVANITLHHVPDFWKQIALCRLSDLLKAGGRLFLADVVFGFDPRTYEATIDRWVADMQDLAGPRMADEIVTHVREEFSTWDWIMRGLLERAGFRVDRSFELMQHMRAYICSK
ncbi:methyltransferase domain-containing protein [candidate division KSB3 bacterium]|uniref:Methyltransferase domain-containing protein n=1 Tax=candidate division KSB3 bacterium TaxID=2044937 RepID=A0A9D5Q6B8_9BACT|nr:methyltransferase domain-containing protein [candidate division KSB3 bacterium]MBD3325243.1 methyltransferase domain-containing protein [candidate division KSB3 bacterium]